MTLYKLRHNQPVTDLDLKALDEKLFNESDDRERFNEVFGKKVKSKWEELENPPLSLLLRSIIGLDRKDVEEQFSKFVSNSDYKSVQYKFIQQIIDRITSYNVCYTKLLRISLSYFKKY